MSARGKYLVLILVVILLSPLALAQEAKESKPHFNRRAFIPGTIALAGAKTFDALETRKLLDRGGWENNPIFGAHPSPAKQAGLNLTFFAAEATVFYFTSNRHSGD